MRLKAKLGFVVATICLVGTSIPGSTPAKAGVFAAYNLPPYICTTGIGCCSAASMPSLVHSMFSGQGYSPDLQQSYYVNTLWPKIQEALKQAADEARNAIYFTLGPRGAFVDAQTFSQTLTSLQKQNSQSIVTQTASDQICRFGTLSRSLAQSDDKARVVQLGLANEMLQREVMRTGMASAYESGVGSKLGRSSDQAARNALYQKYFCDPKNSKGAVGQGGGCATPDDTRQNRDIDTTRTLFNPVTLNLDFSSDGSLGTKTIDEENLIAMASNLFAHDLPMNMGKSDFDAIVKDDGKESDSRKEKLMEYRSLVAKRSVAQNSFAALAGMKAAGSAGSATYVKQMLEYLGLNANAQTAFLGSNPSYYAQMELLTRKLYQSPAFYANLMESPENVARQQTAMEGIGLMQDRDIYESLRRSELVLSSLLEVYVAKDQDKQKDKGTK